MASRRMAGVLRLIGVLALPLAATANPSLALENSLLRLPQTGDTSLTVLSPTFLEVLFVTAPPPGEIPPVAGSPPPSSFEVTVNGRPAAVKSVAFKRRVLYAPVKHRDLRVSNWVYLELAEPLPGSDHVALQVRATQAGPWPADLAVASEWTPARYNPALHVNQEGYTTGFPKIAMVGYYLGSGGELPVPLNPSFSLVDAKSGATAFAGNLRPRRDVGFTGSPPPYRQVREADFSKFDQPGEYRLVVPGFGASLPFRIDDGILMNFVRAYALGLYHQRCGTTNEEPFTRFIHAACHVAPAEIPVPSSSFAAAWKIIGNLHDKKPPGPAPELKDEASQLYPFVKQGKIDVSGGHHDAGDYSKYTINSAALVHTLMFAVDALPGVGELDNLGLPESGDGVSDLLQEAKWESDFLAKLQDDDGGFYFLVYPKERRYEDGTPDKGDPQIVWPKNTAVTAAAIAALAQCASSPAFRHHYPDVAKRYLAQAEKGWKFLEAAIAKHGKAGSYQQLTHYGDNFTHDDELAWAAAELYIATGEPAYQQKLFEWFPNPNDPETRMWGWWRAAFCYGNTLRAYAFAGRAGKLPADKLDARYLAQCEAELRAAGDDATRWSNDSAYGTSLDEATKRQRHGGWYFSSDRAFDITVAQQLRDQPKYAEAVIANLNYEAGCNPVNVSFITGTGIHRQREIVHQYAQGDFRTLPPSGLPLGQLTEAFHYMANYKTELRDLSYPADDDPRSPYPIYDRWSDAFNVAAEFVVTNQARSLASLAYWATKTKARSTAWKPVAAKILLPARTAGLHEPMKARLEAPGLDLGPARIVWEGRDQEPAFGTEFTLVPKSAGAQWVEAEACLPDGRRVTASARFSADSPVVFWLNGALPEGAQPLTTGGDNWKWSRTNSKPPDFANSILAATPQHESEGKAALHEHGFDNASATLAIDAGDVLFAYVCLDAASPPKEIMLNWNDGTWEHRAYWGANLISYGRAGTPGRREMGPLPAAGQWVRLEVPAKEVALEGRTVKGMTFSVQGGRAIWDVAGKMSEEAKQSGGFPVPKK